MASTDDRLDTVIRYLYDPRNPDTNAAFHELAEDVLKIRRGDAAHDGDAQADDEGADAQPSSGVGGEGDAATSAAASPPRQTTRPKGR